MSTYKPFLHMAHVASLRMLALPTILSTMTRWSHRCLIFRRSYTPTMRPRFSWWISGIRRQSSNGPQKYNNMHIQRTFYAHDSCPYGQLVVLLGDYKGGGMMIVRCSTAPLMIITLVHLISMRTFHYIFIFGIHRNTKSCPLPCWCIDGGIIQYIN